MNAAASNIFFLNFSNGFGAMIGQNIPKILIVVAALIGLGWGIRKFIRHVAGGSGFSNSGRGLAPMRDMEFGEKYTSQTSYLGNGGSSGSDPKFL